MLLLCQQNRSHGRVRQFSAFQRHRLGHNGCHDWSDGGLVPGSSNPAEANRSCSQTLAWRPYSVICLQRSSPPSALSLPGDGGGRCVAKLLKHGLDALATKAVGRFTRQEKPHLPDGKIVSPRAAVSITQ